METLGSKNFGTLQLVWHNIWLSSIEFIQLHLNAKFIKVVPKLKRELYCANFSQPWPKWRWWLIDSLGIPFAGIKSPGCEHTWERANNFKLKVIITSLNMCMEWSQCPGLDHAKPPKAHNNNNSIPFRMHNHIMSSNKIQTNKNIIKQWRWKGVEGENHMVWNPWWDSKTQLH